MRFKSDIEAEANVDIDGDILFNGDTTIQLSSGLLKIGDVDGSGAITSMDFIVDGTEAIEIDSSANVGIGVASSGSKLHVNGVVEANSGFKYQYSGTDTFQITSIFGAPYILIVINNN